MKLRFYAACLCVMFSTSALADDVAQSDVAKEGLHFDAGVGTQYDSNVFFVADHEVDTASAVAELSSGYRWQGELTGVEVALDGRYQPYEDSSLEAASAVGVAVTLDREHEFGNTRMLVSYRDESSLINAFNDDGKFVGDERQHTAATSFSRSFEMSETSSIVAHVDGSRVTYENTPPDVQRDDYDFATGSTQWEWHPGEQTTFGAGLVGSWYSSDGRRFSNEVTTFGPLLSLRHEFSESTSASLEGSYRRSRADAQFFGFINQQDTGGNYYGRAAVTRQFEQGYFAVEASRSVSPGSSGRQDIRDELVLRVVRELTERAMLRGGAVALKSAPHSQGSVADDGDKRTAFAGDIGVDYTLAERMTLSAGYRYLWQDTDAPNTDAHAQTVMVTLRWAFGASA